MSQSVYSEINFHITWHTKNNMPVIRDNVESRLFHFLTHKILETPGVRFHAIGGIEEHIHIAISAQPNLLMSDWIGKLKGSSSHYINHNIQGKLLEWQRGYGIISFGTKDLQWVVNYVLNQKDITKMERPATGLKNMKMMMTAKASIKKDVKTPLRLVLESHPRRKQAWLVAQNAERRLKPPSRQLA